jgi:hypothetical protein
VNAIELMYREFGIHPKTAATLIRAGYVTAGGEKLKNARLTPAMSGKTLHVLGRRRRLQIPTVRRDDPDLEQGELF